MTLKKLFSSLFAFMTICVFAVASPASAGPSLGAFMAGVEQNSGETLVVTVGHRKYSKRHYKKRFYKKRYYKKKRYSRRYRRDHVHVDAPFTRYGRHHGRVAVDAPFAMVRRSRRGVYVRAPFVNLWVPRY